MPDLPGRAAATPGAGPPDSMRTLALTRCTLEPLLATHAEAMFEVLSDPAIYAFEGAPPASPDWLRARYLRLESRRSPDGRQQWLNWVLRLPGGDLAGHVQATVLPGGFALVAYELASRHWRQGIGSAAVRAMLGELAATHGVHTAVAVLKAGNHRSAGLLRHLGFAPGLPPGAGLDAIDADEIACHRAGLAGLPDQR
jgi:ribosomal-protein-alanine N-acetyltransferase